MANRVYAQQSAHDCRFISCKKSLNTLEIWTKMVLRLLVDADIASNSASWQWVAGTGADAAPYFQNFQPYNTK